MTTPPQPETAFTESMALSSAAAAGSKPMLSTRIKPILRRNGLIIFLALLLVLFTIMRPEFLSQANIRNILLSASVIGILAVGQTIVMLTGGFDLSVAKIAIVAGIVVALVAPMGPLLAITSAIAAAMLVGLVNGTLIAKARVNPFVVTLGMFTILISVALLLNNGASVTRLPEWLDALLAWNVGWVPGIVIWFVIVALAAHVLLSYTKFGRHIYAVGGNVEASRLAGINVDRVLTAAYILCAVCAGIAGILLTARLGTASPVALPGAELDAIAAVIIGGTLLGGGFGSIPRTIIGVVILSALSSGLILLGVASYWQGFFKGVIIILAVAVDVIFNSRRR